MSRLVALVLPLLLACGPGGNLTVSFDTNSIPQEVAFQDGDGPWRVVQLVDGAAELPVTDPAGRYGVATANESGFSRVTKATLWEQSRFTVRSASTDSSSVAAQVPHVVALTGVKVGAAYSAWLGFSGPHEFVATAPKVDLSFSTTDSDQGPLVVIQRATAQPRVFAVADFEAPEVALEGGVEVEAYALPVTGLAARDSVVVSTQCSVATASGVTRLQLESEGRLERGKAVGGRLPPAFGACEYDVVVKKEAGVTWSRSLSADEPSELPHLSVHLDRLAGSLSWTPKGLDDDSHLSFRIGALNAEVHPGWRHGASSVSLGDMSATPLLSASARRGPAASVSVFVRDWFFSWHHAITD